VAKDPDFKDAPAPNVVRANGWVVTPLKVIGFEVQLDILMMFESFYLPDSFGD